MIRDRAEYMRAWRRHHRERARDISRRASRKHYATRHGRLVQRRGWWRRKYGITEKEVYTMLAAQGGRCKTCRHPLSMELDAPPANRGNIDHCHQSGRVRGILCSPCNISLGHYERRPFDFTVYLGNHIGH